jgi:ATP-dependent Clp protease ATP-binding subunit ClpC
VGSKEIIKGGRLGFSTGNDKSSFMDLKDKAMSALNKVFNPEFLNRVDEVVVFHPLKKDHIGKIIDLMLEESRKQLVEKSMSFEITDAARKFLIDRGYDEKFGARPLRRTIQREVEDPLANEILKGTFQRGSEILIDFQDNKIFFKENNKKKKKRELEKVETV